MYRHFLAAAIILGALTALLSAGCGSDGGNVLATDPKLRAGRLGIAWHEYIRLNQKPPAGWSDLTSSKMGAPLPLEVQQSLASYTVAWGTKVEDITVGEGDFILAYPPEAATAGGFVVMLSGKAREVTAQGFRELLDAQSKSSGTSDTETSRP